MTLEYYVLNFDHNACKVKAFNVFDNCTLEKYTLEELKEYTKDPNAYIRKRRCDNKILKGFPAFCEELRSLIMWQEWSRSEYEIMVGGAFSKEDEFQKIDCYEQCLPNIEMIAHEVIYQYEIQSRKG